MGTTEKFCLRWNDFETNITGSFKELKEDEDFLDVTLACADGQIQAHKLILSACSPFFRTILRRNKHEHPLLYLKGVKYADCISILNFMYHGEVNVAKDDLNSFLAVAEDLKVRGLTQDGPDLMTSDDVTQEPRTESLKHNVAPPDTVAAIYREPTRVLEEVTGVKPENTVEDVYSEYATTDLLHAEAGEGKDIVGGSDMEYEDLTQIDTSGGGTYTAQDKVGGEEDVDMKLDHHISRQVGQERTDYVCLLCSKCCKSRDECANHIEVHHLKIVRSCPYCGIELTSRGGLRQHISRKHREEHKLAKGNTIYKPKIESQNFYNFQ